MKIKYSRPNIPDNVIVTIAANGRSATKKAARAARPFASLG
jgi:hypothetical protein